MKKKSVWLCILHIALLIYSAGGIFSKTAAQATFGSWKFFLLYGGVLGTLAVYAVIWQQVIKHLPLTTAFANKAVTVVWGMILGFLVFKETVSIRQIVAAMIIIAGIVLYVWADRSEQA